MAKSSQLFVGHLRHLKQFSILISCNEFLDNHEATADTNDQFAVQDLRVNFLRAEQVETVSNLSNRDGTVSLVDVVAEHLIEQITFGQLEHRSLLLVANLHVHYLNNLVLIFKQRFHLLNLVDLLGNRL